MDDKLLGSSLSSICGFHRLEVEFLRRENDSTLLVIGRYIEDGFEDEVPFLLLVGWAGPMRFPLVDLDVMVAKPTAKTSGWGLSLLRLDLRRYAELLGGSKVFLTSDM